MSASVSTLTLPPETVLAVIATVRFAFREIERAGRGTVAPLRKMIALACAYVCKLPGECVHVQVNLQLE